MNVQQMISEAAISATLADVLKKYYWRRRMDVNHPEECEEFMEYIVQRTLRDIKDPDQAEQVVSGVIQKIERGHIDVWESTTIG